MKIKLLHIYLFLILISQNSFSQKNDRFQFKPSFSIGSIYPIEFGKTALSEAHSANIGLTSTLGLLKYSAFSAGLGLDMISYKVENKQIIGDYETSKHNSYFIFVNYDYDLSEKFSLTPTIGYGSSELVIKKDSKRRGLQDGKEFRIGSSLNYNLNNHNSLCISLLYVNNSYNINTNESIKDFFKKSNSLQLGVIYKIK